MNNYQKELIQVAASCLAALQNDETGTTNIIEDGHAFLQGLLNKVGEERYFQESKWGIQNHSRERWLAIIVEEVGEVAKEVLENS